MMIALVIVGVLAILMMDHRHAYARGRRSRLPALLLVLAAVLAVAYLAAR